jgi:membrane-bound lytic murein transglycosylase A
VAPSPVFTPVRFDDLPGWRADPVAQAFAAFRRSALRVALEKPYRTGALGVTGASFEPAFADALELPFLDDDEARAFFETWFEPFRVTPDSPAGGFVTGFYEPEAEASPVRTDAFRFPILARPDDLVDIDDGNRPAGLDPSVAFGRATAEGIVA